MKSMFTLKEICDMLNMTISDVEEKINEGYLSYTFSDGEKKISLYDLEKYMGTSQAQKIIQDYLSNRAN